MSPQQWTGEEPTVADDIYSIGSTVYELLTGKPPFYEGDIFKQVYEMVPPRMSERLAALGIPDVEIPAAFEETVAACLEKNPAMRPANVNEVAARLGLTGEPPPSAVPFPPKIEAPIGEVATEFVSSPVAARWGNGFWLGIGAIGLLAVLLAGVLVVPRILSALASTKAAGVARGGRFPTADKPWQNSLGMKFVPVPGAPVLFSVWETRVQDFTAFVDDTGREPPAAMQTLDASGVWKRSDHSWREPGYPQGTNYPVVGIGWSDAASFCVWLTTRERAAGWISTNQSYRLPTAAEWALAAGPNKFVWGNEWPPPPGTGNFAGEEIHQLSAAHPTIAGYQDGFAGAAPVGSFKPNAFGIYDLSGNVAEFCADRDATDAAHRRIVLGGSWSDSAEDALSILGRARTRENVRRSDRGFRCVLAFHGSGQSNNLESTDGTPPDMGSSD